MAWTTTSDLAVGHVVTAAEWNANLGASGNTQYLYTQSHTATQATTSKIFGTEYQNTTGKIIFAAIILSMNLGATGTCQEVLYSSSTSPATTGMAVGVVGDLGALNTVLSAMISVPILPGYYHKLISNDTAPATTSITKWTEWVLF